jgi:hypothetical protein
MSKIHRPLVLAAGLALAAGALGTGVSYATSGSHNATAPNATTTAPAKTKPVTKAATVKSSPTGAAKDASGDTDNVQQGDQTTPDVPGSTDPGESSSSETGSENGTSETGPSDGPGGHADPAGNVDHQFEGTE